MLNLINKIKNSFNNPSPMTNHAQTKRIKRICKIGDKHTIPYIGIGTLNMNNEVAHESVLYALSIGYRHIDCASVYDNESGIGKALKEAKKLHRIKREDVFITNKLWNTDHNPKNVLKACKNSLKKLQVDYLDLYLIHWGVAFDPVGEREPMGGMIQQERVSTQQTWKAMELLVKKGLVKSIGVANFTCPMIMDVLSYATIKPAANQVEIHPYNTQQELVEFCKKRDIVVTGYSPLGSSGDVSNKPITNSTITNIAKRYKISPAQTIIRWCLQRGIVSIPRSTNEAHIKQNIDVFHFSLTTKEMASISRLNKNLRFTDPKQGWGIPYFS